MRASALAVPQSRIARVSSENRAGKVNGAQRPVRPCTPGLCRKCTQFGSFSPLVGADEFQTHTSQESGKKTNRPRTLDGSDNQQKRPMSGMAESVSRPPDRQAPFTQAVASLFSASFFLTAALYDLSWHPALCSQADVDNQRVDCDRTADRIASVFFRIWTARLAVDGQTTGPTL